jgi:ABC-type branched-subunit amino acid transport system ATPase component
VTAVLRLDALNSGYGAKTVIEAMSFALEAGEILALLGHNGAGKTTTLKAIIGLLSARGGSISLRGERIEKLSTAERVRRGLRLLPEGRGIFPQLTVAENIDVVAAQNCGRGPMFDPRAIYRLFPVMDERRSSTAGKLSGGQQQMLALSLALLGAPRCLMLDEPSIGLAPNLVQRMFDQLRELSRDHGLPTLLVEQNVSAAMRVADRVVILNSGAVVFDGTPEEARKTNVWRYF